MDKKVNRQRSGGELQRYLGCATKQDIGKLCIFYDKIEDVDLSKIYLCVVGVLEDVSRDVGFEKYKKHDTETMWVHASVIPVNVFIEFPNMMQDLFVDIIKKYNKEKGEE